VKQFDYEKFEDAKVRSKKKKRTSADRYREAVRATHLIASELAGIADDDEYDDMLQFVMNQWRNVRQRKMTKERPIQTNTPQTCNTSLDKKHDSLVKAHFGISSSDEDLDPGDFHPGDCEATLKWK